MCARAIVSSGLLAGGVVILGPSLAWAEPAQPQPNPTQPATTEGGGPRGNRTPEQMRQRYMDQIKQSLQASDEDWKAIQPAIENLMALSRDAGVGGRRGMFGGRGGTPQGGTAAGAAAPAPSDAAKATEDLENTLKNDKATPEEINAKLTALRDARVKSKKQLAEAQTALKERLSPRQQAQLVLQGLLD